MVFCEHSVIDQPQTGTSGVVCQRDQAAWTFYHILNHIPCWVILFQPARRTTNGWYFRPSLRTVAPMDEGTILLYCCPSTFSLASPPPSQSKHTVYTDSVWLWGGGGCWVVLWTIFCFWPDSEPKKLLKHPKQKLPVKTTFRDWCL